MAPAVADADEIARAAYETFFSGFAEVVPWERLPEKVKARWRETAQAVILKSDIRRSSQPPRGKQS